MAKKDSKSNALSGAVTIIIIIVAILYYAVITLLAITPFILLLYGIICFFLFRGKKDKNLIQRNFWLSKAEQEEFIKINNLLYFYQNKRDNAWEAVSREGVRINKDGSISQRSYRGQDLQGAINESNEMIKKYTPRFEELKKIPSKNWKRVGNHFVNRIAMPVALCIGLIATFGPDLGINFGGLLGDKQIENVVIDTTHSESTDTTSTEGDSSQELVNPTIAILSDLGLASIKAWVVCAAIMLIIYSMKFPKPKAVTIDNVRSN